MIEPATDRHNSKVAIGWTRPPSEAFKFEPRSVEQDAYVQRVGPHHLRYFAYRKILRIPEPKGLELFGFKPSGQGPERVGVILAD